MTPIAPITPIAKVRISEFYQGPTGRGQGGWTASRLAAHMEGPATIRLAAPTPLNRDLHVVPAAEGLNLIDPETGALVMEARPWAPDPPMAAPVSIEAAAAARGKSSIVLDRHPAPRCFSCGLDDHSMGVHAGLLGDGRVASDWRAPEWAIDGAGVVDPGVLWASLDCTSGFYVSGDGDVPLAFTAQYAVAVLKPIDPDGDYALVAGPGGAPTGWEGRKRRAVAVAYDRAGDMAAFARSFWVAARERTHP